MPPSDESVTVGELARQVRDVFSRFEGLARRLEDGQFVRTDLYGLYKENVNQSLFALERAVESLEKSKASQAAHIVVVDKVKDLEDDKVDRTEHTSLVDRVAQLEDDKKWLVRLVIGFIVLGVLGAIFVASGGGSPT